MKVLKHGRYFVKSLPVQCACECGCEMEVEENDFEGGSTPFVWCPECREAVFLPTKHVQKFVQSVT